MGHFIDHIRDELRIPDINGELCVHSLAECATCQRCVDACPRQAWILDEDALKLNVDQCDGCGLCVPACSEGAISQAIPLSIRAAECGKAVFIHCQRNQYDNQATSVPCIHAMGLRELVQCSAAAIKSIVTATGDCQACDRIPETSLTDNLEEFNRFLKDHKLPELSLYSLDEKTFRHHWQESLPFVDAGPIVSRRFFLRTALSETVDKAFESSLVAGQQREKATPPLLTLSAVRLTGKLFPSVPIIDAEACNGCDACTRLCPHQALVLSTGEFEQQYLIEAARCSNCHLCIDVCDQNAVQVQPWAKTEQHAIPLNDATCPQCGVHYHLPEAYRGRVSEFCPICTQADHNQNLYQVIE